MWWGGRCDVAKEHDLSKFWIQFSKQKEALVCPLKFNYEEQRDVCSKYEFHHL